MRSAEQHRRQNRGCPNSASQSGRQPAAGSRSTTSLQDNFSPDNPRAHGWPELLEDRNDVALVRRQGSTLGTPEPAEGCIGADRPRRCGSLVRSPVDHGRRDRDHATRSAASRASVSGLWAGLTASSPARPPIAATSLAAAAVSSLSGVSGYSAWALRMLVPRFGRRVVGMDLVVVLLVVLIVLALVGSIAVSPLLWAFVVILVLFAVLGRGRYYARRG